MPIPSSGPRPEMLDVLGNGVRLHYAHLAGEGPPALFIHGIGMDHRVWQALSRRVHPSFDLYMIDLRGHGGSNKPLHGYSIADYAADIEELLETLDVGPWIVAGSSLGGMVTAAIEAPPDVVSHRVLIDPPLTGGPVRDIATFRQILALKHRPVPELATFLAGSYPRAGTHLLRSMSEMWHQAADGVLLDPLANSEHYFDVDPALATCESPTLIVQADPDLGSVLSTAQARHALSLLPQGELVFIPGSGHAVHADKPVEFVSALTEFVFR